MTQILTEQDRDRIQETVESEGYRLLRQRMEAMLERERNSLESPEDTDAQMRDLQGRCAALRAVLALPETMMAECEPTRGKRG